MKNGILIPAAVVILANKVEEDILSYKEADELLNQIYHKFGEQDFDSKQDAINYFNDWASAIQDEFGGIVAYNKPVVDVQKMKKLHEKTCGKGAKVVAYRLIPLSFKYKSPRNKRVSNCAEGIIVYNHADEVCHDHLW